MLTPTCPRHAADALAQPRWQHGILVTSCARANAPAAMHWARIERLGQRGADAKDTVLGLPLDRANTLTIATRRREVGPRTDRPRDTSRGRARPAKSPRLLAGRAFLDAGQGLCRSARSRSRWRPRMPWVASWPPLATLWYEDTPKRVLENTSLFFREYCSSCMSLRADRTPQRTVRIAVTSCHLWFEDTPKRMLEKASLFFREYCSSCMSLCADRTPQRTVKIVIISCM